MVGPKPAFSPRQIFTDHNYAGDAFLQGLGNANLSPAADISDGLKQGIIMGQEVSNLIQQNSAEAVEARRIALETGKHNLEIAKHRSQSSAIKARRDAALEADALAQEEAEMIAATVKAQDSIALSNDRIKAQEVLGQIQDPYSFKKALEDPTFISLVGDKQIAAQVESKAARMVAYSRNPQEQVEIIKASQTLAPGSIGRLSAIATPEAQRELLDPIKKEQLDYYDARTDATRSKAAGLGSGVLSEPARQQVRNVINGLPGGEIPPGAMYRSNSKGKPSIFVPRLDANGQPVVHNGVTKMDEYPIVASGKEGPLIVAEIERQVKEKSASTPLPANAETSKKDIKVEAFTTAEMETALYQKVPGKKSFTRDQVQGVVRTRLQKWEEERRAYYAKQGKTAPNLTTAQRTKLASVLHREFIEEEYNARNQD